jgi:hypothetical protein
MLHAFPQNMQRNKIKTLYGSIFQRKERPKFKSLGVRMPAHRSVRLTKNLEFVNAKD